MKQILTIIVTFVSVFISHAQTCTNMHIRGPLACATGVTSDYHVVNSPIGVGAWSTFPIGVGTIVPSGSNATVTWNILPAALIYKIGTCSDTIFLQKICTEIPTGALQIVDLSSITTPNLILFAAAVGGTYANSSITVTSKTLFIEGELNFENSTPIHFINCTIYMATGSVMYFGNANISGNVYFNTCTVQGKCNMWQGIKVSNHGRINAVNTTFSDAEYCIPIFEQELRLQLDNCTFSKNFVSIYSPTFATGNVFSWYSNPTDRSYFKHCTFSGVDPILLPIFYGQSGIPLGQKPFAGMFFNDLQAVNANSLSLLLSTDPSETNSFVGLNFGIYAVNSNLDVYNCNFTNCQPVTAYTGTSLYNGTSIFSKVNIGSPYKFIKAGDQDISTTARYRNEFYDCRRGIVTMNNINSTIKYNNFVHPSAATTISGTGIYLKDADYQNAITIQNNTFNDDHLVIAGSPTGLYASNGIVITSATQTRKFLNISLNTFEDQKIAIYVSNSRGNAYSDYTFSISNNLIKSTITPSSLTAINTTYFGIWLSAVSRGIVHWNTFNRAYPLSMEPANFKNLMFGMNVVNSTDVSIAANDFITYGTSMRYVSNCNGTTLKCNTMISNVQGVSLAAASMTNQGYPGEAWDNKWDGFPTTSSTTYNRADGTNVPFNWYSRNASNTTGFSNRFSPEPVNTQYITPYPLQASPGCSIITPPGGDRNERISRIVKDEIIYEFFPEESRYLDQEFAYYALKEDTTLRDSIADFGNYYDSLNVSNFGKFDEAENLYQNGELDAALAKLDLIVDNNVIEYNKKYTLQIAINQKKNDSEELTEEQISELMSIAWTNIWLGGPGVITARHLLGEQVFDLDNNLKIARPTKGNTVLNPNISVYPNPSTETITVFYDKSSIESLFIRLTDLTGRVVLSNKLESNIIKVHSIPNGIYSLSFYANMQFLSSLRVTILH